MGDQIGYSRAIPLPDSTPGQSRSESDAGDVQESLTPFLSEPRSGDTGSCNDETNSADDSRSNGRREPRPALPLLPDLKNNRYSIQSEHARGGLGRILVAQDVRLDRPVAVKELLRSGADAEARFTREALITARLQHPSIVPVYDLAWHSSGKPFYAMKLVSGRSLSTLIKEKTTLAERLALLPNVIAVADAMAYAHGEGVIHRDLKPSNVMVGPFGETIVIDWGLAADLRSARCPSRFVTGAYEIATSGLTVVGTVLGTPEYMPLEQSQGKPVDERADVYAIGAILYHVLAGCAPYQGGSSAEVLAKVAKEDPVPIRQRLPGVPQELATIVGKAMSRDAAARYPTAKELADDLKRFQTGQMVSAHSYSRMAIIRRWLWRNRTPALVAAASLVMLAVMGATSLRRIIREKDRAEDARRVAEKAQIASEESRSRAEESRNDLILQQASAALERDPTAALAWLKLYPMRGPKMPLVRDIAAQAYSFGVAKHVFHTAANPATVAKTRAPVSFSPDGKRLALATGDNSIELRDVLSGRKLAALNHDGSVRTVQFSPQGESILFFDSENPALYVWNPEAQVHELRGHTGNLSAALFSPDGRLIASAAADGTIRIWDLHHERHSVLSVPDSPATQLAFSPNGKQLASSGQDGVVWLWDLATMRGRALRGHSGDVAVLAFAPDGRRLASAGRDSQVIIWSLATGSRSTLRGHVGFVLNVAFSPDGALLATGGQDKTVRLWNVGTCRLWQSRSQANEVWGLAFSPNGKSIAVSSQNGSIELWDFATGTSEVLRGHTADIYELLYSPDGRFLASFGMDKQTRVWDMQVDRPIVLSGHRDEVYHVAFLPSSRQIVSASRDQSIAVWDLSNGDYRSFRGHRGLVFRVAAFPDGRNIASAGFDGTVRAWDVMTGQGRILHRHRGLAWDVAISSDGKLVASGGDDGIVAVSHASGDQVRRMYGHDGQVRSIAFSPDGALVASAGADKTVRVWNLHTGQAQVLEGHRDLVYRVTFSPNGRLIASASYDKTVRIWDVAAAAAARVLSEHRARVRTVAFSPQGQWVASGAGDGTVWLSNIGTGASYPLRGHRNEVRYVSFSPDGDLLASASDDGTVRLWRVSTQSLVSMGRHRKAVLVVRFSPDGRSMATASTDDLVKVWNISRNNLPEDALELRAWIESTSTAPIGGDAESKFGVMQ